MLCCADNWSGCRCWGGERGRQASRHQQHPGQQVPSLLCAPGLMGLPGMAVCGLPGAASPAWPMYPGMGGPRGKSMKGEYCGMLALPPRPAVLLALSALSALGLLPKPLCRRHQQGALIRPQRMQGSGCTRAWAGAMRMHTPGPPRGHWPPQCRGARTHRGAAAAATHHPQLGIGLPHTAVTAEGVVQGHVFQGRCRRCTGAGSAHTLAGCEGHGVKQAAALGLCQGHAVALDTGGELETVGVLQQPGGVGAQAGRGRGGTPAPGA
jgi:hypothetical protein